MASWGTSAVATGEMVKALLVMIRTRWVLGRTRRRIMIVYGVACELLSRSQVPPETLGQRFGGRKGAKLLVRYGGFHAFFVPP